MRIQQQLFPLVVLGVRGCFIDVLLCSPTISQDLTLPLFIERPRLMILLIHLPQQSTFLLFYK